LNGSESGCSASLSRADLKAAVTSGVFFLSVFNTVIPRSQLDQRGKVTGTRVGVAAGDGEVDLPGIIEVLKNTGYDGVLSAECDTFDQATRSLAYLKALIE
jgi:hypothetical protein